MNIQITEEQFDSIAWSLNQIKPKNYALLEIQALSNCINPELNKRSSIECAHRRNLEDILSLRHIHPS